MAPGPLPFHVKGTADMSQNTPRCTSSTLSLSFVDLRSMRRRLSSCHLTFIRSPQTSQPTCVLSYGLYERFSDERAVRLPVQPREPCSHSSPSRPLPCRPAVPGSGTAYRSPRIPESESRGQGEEAEGCAEASRSGVGRTWRRCSRTEANEHGRISAAYDAAGEASRRVTCPRTASTCFRSR